ncbi:hypothetical protein Tco_1123423 [Tanacetum coccineum]|uniref:Uncharacterized protein n=1 Tax=Tanacetum coccineum TaxID=301880 RepID=A0ABQ5J689_9ASTR
MRERSSGNGYSRKGTKRKPQTNKPSTGVKRPSQSQSRKRIDPAPTEGYEDAIVVLKSQQQFRDQAWVANSCQNKPSFEHDKRDPQAHILTSIKSTSTVEIAICPDHIKEFDAVPFALEGAAQIMLRKEPPRSSHMDTSLLKS